MADLTKIRNELDDIGKKLRTARRRLVVVWALIENHRHGSVSHLDKYSYTDRKVEMFELQRLIPRLEEAASLAFNEFICEWIWTNPRPTKVSLKELWRMWRNVVAARRAVPARVLVTTIKTPPHTDMWHAEVAALHLANKVTVRQQIEAEFARDRAEWSYDMALRVFEGRPAWCNTKHLGDGWRLRPPQLEEPTPLSRIEWKQKQRRAKFAEPYEYRKVLS
jgi:hypothetical protein